jgi:hypothetical protein
MNILFNTKLASFRFLILFFISLLTLFSVKAQTEKTETVQKKDSSTESYSKKALDSIKTSNNREQIITDSINIINRKIRLTFDSINQLRKRELWMEDSMKVALLNKKKNIIKVTPLAFVLGYTVIGYERSIAKRQSLELRLGIIGSGFGVKNQKLNQSGVYGIVGYKINIDKLKPTRHILHGLFLRPEFLIGGYSLKYKNSIYSSGKSTPETRIEEHKITYRIISVSLGKQIYDKKLTLEIFATAGLGFYTQTAESVGIVDKIRYGNPLNMKDERGSDGIFKVGFFVGTIF